MSVYTPSCSECLNKEECNLHKEGLYNSPDFALVDIVTRFVEDRFPELRGIRFWVGMASCPMFKEKAKVSAQARQKVRGNEFEGIDPLHLLEILSKEVI